ncbi:MAG TPA: PHP domain-containing protein [Vicinamibacterales bacterium]|nr:PHP domain-containing protein [Vicinamibacterales bacterium]
MIDLHLHTTASDGRSTPEQLVRRLIAAGIRTCAITDHDTIAGLDRARAAARGTPLAILAGIEITAVHGGVDVHMLGYAFHPDHPELTAFLAAQRADRLRRVLEIFDRLESLGVVLSREPILKRAKKLSGRAVGRPAVAKLLVSHGHARSIADAFDRYLGAGRPAFVSRRGVAPADVIALIGRAGGLVSFAHPGKMGRDDLLPALASAGLGAIEAFHPDHDAEAVQRYTDLARTLDVGVSGGSDYHGPGSGRAEALGTVTLPEAHFAELRKRIEARS